MAYEQTWSFIPAQGPFTASSRAQGYAYWLWFVKAMLTGGNSFDGVSAIPNNGGRWTVYGSSDGTTAALDGVDRWGPTFDYTKIPAPGGWVALTRIWNNVSVYLVLSNRDNNFLGTTLWTGGLFTGALTGGGSTSAPPTWAQQVGPWQPYNNNGVSTYGDNFTVARRFYGGVSAQGNFWAAETTAGELEAAMSCWNPVGCKVNDSYPFFFRANIGGSNSGGGFGAAYTSLTFSGAGAFLYNGVAGYHRIMPPTDSKLLDSTDYSVFDFPCFIECYNNQTPSSATIRHARGRLPDVGVTSGSTTASSSTTRPVSNGVTFRDGNGNIQYIAMDYLILPYNSLVV